eukprot:1161212-Pelagomonas_calceolata.AAC.3
MPSCIACLWCRLWQPPLRPQAKACGLSNGGMEPAMFLYAGSAYALDCMAKGTTLLHPPGKVDLIQTEVFSATNLALY